MSQVSLLLVDDDELVRRLIGQGLRRRPWLVEEVGTASEAIALLAEREFDAVITDVHLPDSDSEAPIVEAFRARHPDRPVVITTGAARAFTGTIDRATAWLAKPYRVQELVDQLRELGVTGR